MLGRVVLVGRMPSTACVSAEVAVGGALGIFGRDDDGEVARQSDTPSVYVEAVAPVISSQLPPPTEQRSHWYEKETRRGARPFAGGGGERLAFLQAACDRRRAVLTGGPAVISLLGLDWALALLTALVAVTTARSLCPIAAVVAR